MSSADTHPPVVIEAPIGTGVTVVHTDGKIERIPFVGNQIDWKAFEEAVLKINKPRKVYEINNCRRS